VTRTMRAATAMLALSAGVAFAQAPAGEMPKPGPEHKKLGYFVGKWTTEGEVKANPFMPSGKMTSHDTCEWFEGGFSVVCKSEGMTPWGPQKGLGVMGYSPEEKKYTYFGIDNGPMAMTSIPLGTVDGKTWTYEDAAKMGGKVVHSRYVITEQSPTAYTFSYQMQGEDGAWMTLMEGRTTK
jgi:hypothetical protein